MSDFTGKYLLHLILLVFMLYGCTGGKSNEATITDSTSGASVPGTSLVIHQKVAEWEIKLKDSTEEKNLRMTVELENDSIFKLTYKNTGDSAFRIWTHTLGYGLTWNTIDFESEKGEKVNFKFDNGDREKSGLPQGKQLNPGQSVSLNENLKALLRFRAEYDSTLRFKPGNYRMTVYYNSSAGPLDRVNKTELLAEHWNGKLQVTGPVFKVE